VRNCLVGLLLLLLLLGNGYAIWQIRELRQEVADLRQEVTGLRSASPEMESLTDLVRAALEAVRRGDAAAAARSLDRFAARVSEMKTLAETRKRDLERRAAEAKAALTRKEGEAAAAMERLLHALSLHQAPQGDARR